MDVSKADVEALAREGKSVDERRRWTLREDEKARRKIDTTSKRALGLLPKDELTLLSGISRIQSIQSIITDISSIASEQAVTSDPTLHPLTVHFDSLLHDFKDEYSSLALDEVIVGAIGQVVCVAGPDRTTI